MACSRSNETDDSLEFEKCNNDPGTGGGGEDYSGEGRTRNNSNNNNIQEHMISLGVYNSAARGGGSRGPPGRLGGAQWAPCQTASLPWAPAQGRGPQSSLTYRPALLTAFRYNTTASS